MSTVLAAPGRSGKERSGSKVGRADHSQGREARWPVDASRAQRLQQERDRAAQAWARVTVPFIAQRAVMRRSPDGGRTFPRSSPSGYRYEVAIRAALPDRPTTVPTCDAHTGRGRLLVLDLDASRVPPHAAGDRAGYVAAVAERIVALVAECGGRALVDASPSGGRHVYVLWAQALPFEELRLLARAFARRFSPVVDTSPMESSDGQIRGPGAPHRSEGGRLTGYMTLTCSVEEAVAVCARPCGPQVWARLQDEVAAELAEVTGSALHARHQDAPSAPLDSNGEPWLRRLGGRAPLREDLEHTARTGRFDTRRYPSSSEARAAVLASAAARGWRLEQVRAHLAPGGPWQAIASWWRDEALLRQEWDKAITFAQRQPSAPSPATTPPGDDEVGIPARDCNTSGNQVTPPAPHNGDTPERSSALTPPQPETVTTPDLDKVKAGGWWGLEVRAASWQVSEYQRIRVWQQAMHIVERRLELQWGRRALRYRAVLRAIGAAAQMSCSSAIQFGTRQIAYMAGVDHTTVSRILKDLRTGPYALIDLVMEAEGTRADVYQLLVPDAVAAEAAWRRWRAGRIDAIHPAFRVLGLPAAFAYEALSTAPMTRRELATAALLASSTTDDALKVLAAHGLAERDRNGCWRRGDADLDTVATTTGAHELAQAQLAGHRADRALWHAWLGIIDAAEPSTATGTASTDTADADTADAEPGDTRAQASAAAAPHRPHQRRRDGQRRPSITSGRARDRRAAPPWRIPPPREPIGENDIPWPDEALATLRELLTLTDEPTPNLPDDVRAAVHQDLAVITADDERQAAERAAYESELAVLRATLAADETGR